MRGLRGLGVLHTYTAVPVSGLAHDVRGRDWSAVPRALLLDWLEVFVRAVAVIEPGYRADAAPDPTAFQRSQITSDGPYGSSENFYYLDYFQMETPTWRIAFEAGRQGGNEPIGLTTRELAYEHAAFLVPQAGGPMRATVYLWHGAAYADDVRRQLYSAAP